MLDCQFNLYSVDTGHFYTNREKYYHDMNCKYRRERNYIKNNADMIDLINHKKNKAIQSKNKLTSLFKNKLQQKKPFIRTLRENDLNHNNIISIFNSSLSRTIGIQKDELTDALIIVQIYYYDIFKDISFNGFMYKGEKYKYFTSSAGQIRNKKAVFIKEKVWNIIEKNIMCGLTTDEINKKGGNNVNKHLAYLALSNSATDLWENFDINKTIVIEDFETNVYGTFDFIDDQTYSITQKTDFVPITHTDGCGMILPSVSNKNFMIRAPWIKGLLGVFDFKKMIEVNNYSPIIKDIYGKPHNIFEEDIQIIFTKSQFKMYKYYDSWDKYKEYFKKYNCTAGICNTEEDRIKNAKINYQMLQTLTDITDEEINLLTEKSVEKIKNICKSKDTMLSILGVTPYNTNMTSFQKAIKLYPTLLNDTYTKDILRDVKDSLLKKYRSGKLEINGKYTFLLPDFYAACQYWFGEIKLPQGLLKNNEVFCQLFKSYEKLDCLRSPHLYKEHAIRFNKAYKENHGCVETINEWFTTNALYTSTHDLISKILQFDVDGDKSLVVADPDFIKIAERNMAGIVPLYYAMRKAEPTMLNSLTIYEGLNAAFSGSNIGMYSNNIAKIWNSQTFIDGDEKAKAMAMDVIKLLCMENNFVIDKAKTLYMPQRPDWFKPLVQKYTNCKLPAFFEFAKDKDKSQVEGKNQSFINKIYDKIPNCQIKATDLLLDKPDYHMMMLNKDTLCAKEVSHLYNELNKKYRYMINFKDEYIDNLRFVACEIREAFNNLGYKDEAVADMLVYYLYGSEKRYKQLLWFCYGENIVKNLEKNIKVKKTKVIQCVDCGEWFEVDALNTKSCRCVHCQLIIKREQERNKKRKKRMSPLAST